MTTSVDGVPVFAAEGPPPLSAGLVFGVGRRDEAFVQGGVTHLVEHLVMRAVGRSAADANASVDMTATEFTVSGPPDRVAELLQAVCEALGDLPTADLAVEADVLRAEGGSVAPPAVALLLGELYGTSGVGLAAAGEPALRALGPDEVRAWAARFFTRANAALWLTGPVPDGLRLPLPEGVAPERPAQPRLSPRTPAWGQIPVEARVTVGAEVAQQPALNATLGVLRARLEDELRHRRGVAYSVEAHKVAVDESARVVVLTSDVRAGQEVLAAQLAWRELDRLAEQGPTEAELDRERAEVASYLDDPRSGLEEARAAAHAAVTGIPAARSADLRADVAEVTADAVRQVAGTVRDGALLLVPQDVEPAGTGLGRLPAWSEWTVTGRAFERRRLGGAPKGAQLVVGEEGATLLLGEDRRITVRFADAAGLVRQGPGEWLLVGHDGFTLPLAEDDWRDGAEAVALVTAAVPAERQVVDDDAVDDGVLLLRAPAHRVKEAVAYQRYGARLLSNGEWTVVVPDDGRSPESVADDLSAVLSRSTTGLVLRRSHVELGYVLMRGGKQVDRHQWGVTTGDPALLARATERPEDRLASLLLLEGSHDEVVGHAVEALGLPPEVPGLLHGRQPPGTERVEGLGFRGGARASMRGDFVAPAGTGGVVDRWLRNSRTRPGWYRAANVLCALVSAAIIWLLVTVRELDGGAGEAVVWVLAVSGLASGLWEARPPGRQDPAGETAADREASPTG
ncbi:insulinase family protein [Blastococcus sp. TF02A_35]|uniref:insulinase family protein n=1 Tax=Blastococcus sp. TF02A-35 TaxID=2559612 RepID=UPI001104BD7B|nr:insulinase family protein [Blastococcus sp. TF02A_35]TFV50462.1 insulinase family protein [Blastococcus sp. TF02A_35]